MTLSLRPHYHTFHDKVQCALSEVYRATHARRWRGAPQRPLTRILTAETVNKREYIYYSSRIKTSTRPAVSRRAVSPFRLTPIRG